MDQESNLYAEDDRDDNDIYDDVEEFGLEDEYNEDIPNNDVQYIVYSMYIYMNTIHLQYIHISSKCTTNTHPILSQFGSHHRYTSMTGNDWLQNETSVSDLYFIPSSLYH